MMHDFTIQKELGQLVIRISLVQGRYFSLYFHQFFFCSLRFKIYFFSARVLLARLYVLQCACTHSWKIIRAFDAECRMQSFKTFQQNDCMHLVCASVRVRLKIFIFSQNSFLATVPVCAPCTYSLANSLFIVHIIWTLYSARLPRSGNWRL